MTDTDAPSTEPTIDKLQAVLADADGRDAPEAAEAVARHLSTELDVEAHGEDQGRPS